MMTFFGQMATDLPESAMELLGVWVGGTTVATGLSAFVEYFINSLWQGTLIVVLVAFALRLFGRANGATRHTIWCATLVAVLVVPLLSAGLAGRSELPSAGVSASYEPTPAAAEEFATPGVSMATEKHNPTSRTPREPAVIHSEEAGRAWLLAADANRLPFVAEPRSTMPANSSAEEESAATLLELEAGPWMLALFSLWLGIALLRSVRLAHGYLTVRRILRGCRPLPPDRASLLEARLRSCGTGSGVRLAESDLLAVPALVGFLSPTVVFPSSVVAGLSVSELNCIALHELAHARRRDQWTNLLQRLVDCLFFFNPSVMWVSRRLTLEREIACDDWVVDATGQPRPYAACLARLIECTQGAGYPLPVPGAVFTRQQFFRRVETLLSKRNHRSPRLSRAVALAGAVLLGFVVFQLALAGPLVTVTQAAPPVPEAPPVAPATPAPAAAPTASAVPAPPAPPAVPSSPAAKSAPSPPSAPSAPDAAAAPRSRSTRRAVSASRAPRASRDALAAGEASLRETQATAAEVARGMSEVKQSMAGLSGLSSLGSLADLGDMDFDGSISIHGDNGEVSYSWSDRGHKIRVEMEGEVKFAPDESDVLEISRDGYFRIEERKGGERHELEIVPGRTGSLEYFYSQKGRPQEYDNKAKAWLARALPDVMRRTGLNATERVAHLYSDGGADLVLAETADMESDFVRRTYYEELLKLDGGKGPTVRTILRQMVGHTDSDYETAELLIAMAPFATIDPEARDAYLKTAIGIDSDYETRRVLSAMGSLENLTPEQARALLEVADRMDSDYEKAELLIEVADLCREQPELRRDYLEVLRGIDSDYEKRRTLDAMGEVHDADQEFVAGVLTMAGSIDSDYEKAELLIGMADHATGNDALLEDYLRAVETIESNYEKRRVISELALDDKVGEEALLDLLRVAEGIDSDYEKAEFMIEYGKLYLGSPRLENALHDAVETIDSDYERDRVEAALWRHQKESRKSGRVR